MDNFKLKWDYEDFRKIGVFFKSFMMKGRIINDNILLPELDENIYNCAISFYKALLDILIFGYFSRMEGKEEKKIGKRQKREPGVTATKLLLKDLNNTYLSEWGGEIDFESLTDFAKKRKKTIEEKQEQAIARTNEEKRKRMDNIYKNIVQLISEFYKISQEIDENKDLLNRFVKLINEQINEININEQK